VAGLNKNDQTWLDELITCKSLLPYNIW
jgi:hypothetical protein